MEFQISELEGISIIAPEGKILGGADAAQLNDIVHKLIQEKKNKFIIDLKAVELVNSSGLGILISNLTNVKNNGGDLRLAQVNDKVRQILQITKLLTVFRLFDTLDDAVKSFS